MAKKEVDLIIKIKDAGSDILDDIKDKFFNIKTMVLAAGAAAVAFVTKSIFAYQEAEQVVNKLNQTLVQQGVYSKALSSQYQQMATELQKVTTFGDEATLSAIGQLQAFAGQIPITKETTKAIMDFSTAMGVDLETAAQLVGKSIDTSTNALARYGIEVDTSATKQQKLEQITKAMNDRFGGQAEAAADGLGSMTQFGNVVGDVMQKVGEQFAPIVSDIAKTLTDLGFALIENNSLWQGLATTLTVAQGAVQFIKHVFIGFGETVGAVLSGVAGALGALVQGKFREAGQAVLDMGTNIKNVGVETFTSYVDTVDQLFADQRARQDAAQVEDEEKLRASLQRKNEIQAEAAAKAQEEANAKKEELKAQEIADMEAGIALMTANEEQKLNMAIASLDKQFAAATSHAQRMDILKSKEQLTHQKTELAKTKFEEEQNRLRMQGYSTFFNGLAALTHSKHRELANIGKAAAIFKTTLDAYTAINNALATVPFPANIAAAAGIGVQAFVQVARVSGLQLAEGGIVPATPGGIQATIGEGGRSEAVIPLPKNFDPDAGFGGGMTVIFQGPVLGDAVQAREFALALDRELFNLKKSNESIAFEGVI